MSRKTRAIALAATLVTAMGLIAACVQTQRALNEDCLKDQDCLSGICSQLKCAAAPPLLDGAPQAPPTPEAAVVVDAHADATAADAPAEAAPQEAAPEAAPDSP